MGSNKHEEVVKIIGKKVFTNNCNWVLNFEIQLKLCKRNEEINDLIVIIISNYIFGVCKNN